MENESFIEEFKRYIANPKSRLAIIFAVSVFSVISIVLVFSVISNRNANDELEAAKKIEDNPAEKVQILSEIVKNNPKGIVNSNIKNNSQSNQTSDPQSTFVGNSGYVAVDPTTGLPIGQGNISAVGPNEQPDLTVYNYRRSTETITPGVITNVCNFYYSQLKKDRFTTSEFFDPQNSYYTRTSEYADGSLKGYYSSHYSPTSNETYNYASGDYAVKQTYKSYWYGDRNLTNAVPSYPVSSYPVSYPELYGTIRNYFGGNAIIQRVYQQANRTTYEIRVDYTSDCFGNTNSDLTQYIDQNNKITVITIYTVDAKTFEINNTKSYVSKIDPSTLIYTRDFKVEYKLTDFNQVSADFATNLTSNVKQINWTDYTFDKKEYKERSSAYMRTNHYELVFPLDHDVIVTTVASKYFPPPKQYADYFKDRSYYVSGANGDSTFADVMKQYGPDRPELYYSLSTSNGYPVASYNKYDADADKDRIIKDMDFYNYGFGTTSFVRQMNIGSETVDVHLYQQVYPTYYEPTSYPVSYIQQLADRYPTMSEISYPASFPKKDYYYVNYSYYFVLKDRLYTGNISGWAIDRFLNTPTDNLDWGDYDKNVGLYGYAITNGYYGEYWYVYGGY